MKMRNFRVGKSLPSIIVYGYGWFARTGAAVLQLCSDQMQDFPRPGTIPTNVTIPATSPTDICTLSGLAQGHGRTDFLKDFLKNTNIKENWRH